MKISLIVLAAGNSCRFGSNKLLFEIGKTPMYRAVVDTILKAEEKAESLFFEKIMITKYKELIQDPYLLKHFQIIVNPNSERGISSSIQLGIEGSDKTADAWCFLVCDQPYLKSETICNLIAGWEKSNKELGCVVYKEQLGNPTIFKNKYRDEFMKLTGDVGGKGIIKAHIKDVFCYFVDDEKELEDIDEMKNEETHTPGNC